MAKQKTLYFLQSYGQLGNQLATIAHLLAFAIEYDYVIVYPKSTYLSKHLEIGAIKNGYLRFGKQSENSKLAPVFSKLLRFLFAKRNVQAFGYLVLNKQFIVEEQFNATNQPDVIIVTDWLFRYYKGIIRHQEPIRKLLSFTPDSVEKAKQTKLSLQTEYPNRTMVGVHVRRGDYATWLNGIHFYDNRTYYKWMVQLSEQIPNPVFIVCSNEDINFNNEKNLVIRYVKGSPSEDLYLLSCCRYIIGPPSTFSSWSAFWGDTFLQFLRNKDEKAQVEDFSKFYLK